MVAIWMAWGPSGEWGLADPVAIKRPTRFVFFGSKFSGLFFGQYPARQKLFGNGGAGVHASGAAPKHRPGGPWSDHDYDVFDGERHIGRILWTYRVRGSERDALVLDHHRARAAIPA